MSVAILCGIYRGISMSRRTIRDIDDSGWMPMDHRCIDGRVLRHDPQHDDPYLETDLGECPLCDGKGCDTLRDGNL
jgi:hypothetical protein